ncbi:MAG: hypothetical protein SGARI_001583 [Bacillariaceae sp.]
MAASSVTIGTPHTVHRETLPEVTRNIGAGNEQGMEEAANQSASSSTTGSNFQKPSEETPSSKTPSPSPPVTGLGMLALTPKNSETTTEQMPKPSTSGPSLLAAAASNDHGNTRLEFILPGGASIRCVSVKLPSGCQVKRTGVGASAYSDSIVLLSDYYTLAILKYDRHDCWKIVAKPDSKGQPFLSLEDPYGINIGTTRGEILSLQANGNELCVLMESAIYKYPYKGEGRFGTPVKYTMEAGVRRSGMTPHGLLYSRMKAES